MSQINIKNFLNKKTMIPILAGVLIVASFGLGYQVVNNLSQKNDSALAGVAPQPYGVGCAYGVGTYGTGDCGVVEIKNPDIASLACTPTTVTVGGVTDCTITLTSGTTAADLFGSFDVKIGPSGTVKTCTVPATGTVTTISCTGVTVGSVAGSLVSQVKAATETVFKTGNSITVTLATTPLTPSDIPGLTVTCPTSPVNTTATCTFPLPSGKTLPTDFRLTIGTGSVNQATGTAQACTDTSGTVSCTNVPTGNSVGIIPISGQFTGTANSITATGESVTITGINLAKADWTFAPDQGATSPLFRSTDATTVTIRNLKTPFDLAPSSNTRYTCNLEYRALNDRLIATPTWNAVSTTPVAYNTTTGCVFTITKNQRGSALNYGLRLTVTDTTITNASASNPNTFVLNNEYIYRFQGAGTAVGN